MYGKIIELTPKEMNEIIKKYPIAYCAISPIEWHGNHLPLGTDAIRAEWLITKVCKNIGGILFPTEYYGTDGLVKNNGQEFWYLESVVDKKLIGNFLIEEHIFYIKVLMLVENIIRNNFKILVICTGHLAPQQISALNKIEEQFNNEKFKIILWHSEKATFSIDLMTDDYLHAGIEETSEILYIDSELVKLNELGQSIEEKKLGLDKNLSKLITEEFGQRRLGVEQEQLTQRVNEILRKI